MTKNILMIAYTYYSVDARVIKESEACIKNGFCVDFIALREEENNRQQLQNGVNIFIVNQFKYRGASLIRYLLSYLTFIIKCSILVTRLYIKKRYCMIHINNMPDCLVFCAIIPKLFGAKIILDIHDPMAAILLTKSKIKPNNIKYKLLLYQEKLSAQFSDSVLTVHEPIKYDILMKDGIPENKIQVVANFADDNLFRFNGEYSLRIPLRLVYHGTISERSGLADVLLAINNIENKSKLFLKIFGDGDYSTRLKELIHELNLDDIVDFENKVYFYKKLPDLLKSYHLGLATYKISQATDYMLPVKLLEYISLGLPTITIPNKAITHYFNDQVCFFYEPNFSESLTNLLNKLINDPGLILEKRRKIIQIRKDFLWRNEERKYMHHLQQLLN